MFDDQPDSPQKPTGFVINKIQNKYQLNSQTQEKLAFQNKQQQDEQKVKAIFFSPQLQSKYQKQQQQESNITNNHQQLPAISQFYKNINFVSPNRLRSLSPLNKQKSIQQEIDQDNFNVNIQDEVKYYIEMDSHQTADKMYQGLKILKQFINDNKAENQQILLEIVKKIYALLFCHEKYILQKYSFLQEYEELKTQKKILNNQILQYMMQEYYNQSSKFQEEIQKQVDSSKENMFQLKQMEMKNQFLQSQSKIHENSQKQLKLENEGLQKAKLELEQFYKQIITDNSANYEQQDNEQTKLIKQLRQQILDLKQKVSTQNIQMEIHQQEKSVNVSAEIEKLRQEKKDLQDKLEKLEYDFHEIKSQNNKLQLQEFNLKYQINELQTKLQEINEQNLILQNTNDQYLQELNKIKENYQQMTPRPDFSKAEKIIEMNMPQIVARSTQKKLDLFCFEFNNIKLQLQEKINKNKINKNKQIFQINQIGKSQHKNAIQKQNTFDPSMTTDEE